MSVIKGAVVVALIICIVLGILMVPNGQLATQCGTTAQVSVSYNGAVGDIAAAKAILDANDKEMKALVEQQHFTSYFVQMNVFGITPNLAHNDNPKTQVSYTKSVNFMVAPAEKAVDFAMALKAKGYQPSVNVSSLDLSGHCPQSAMK